MQRRDFLQFAALFGALLPFSSVYANRQKPNGKRLILLELKGGNDGLNTLIPYNNPVYYRSRPKLGIPEKEVLPLNEQVGMHPALQPLLPLWKEGQMAWIQGLGYANQNRSHFKSIEIWDSAELDGDEEQTGWVIKQSPPAALQGIAINSSLGPLYTEDQSVLGLDSVKKFVKRGRRMLAVQHQTKNDSLAHVLSVQNEVNQFARQLLKRLEHVPPVKHAFAKNRFGNDLHSLYQLIASGFPVPVLKVALSGFDMHNNQLVRHQRSLQALAEGMIALQKNLAAIGQWDNTLIMSYSEFGRRLKENGSGGTDHGSAAPHFVMGGAVKGGLYGRYPSLKQLDQRGDPLYTTDFRAMYATVGSYLWGGDGTVGGESLGFV